MCSALNSEPIESEVPVEYDDLLLDVQEALSVYSKLRDEWDTMNGIYLGKNLTGLVDVLQILNVEKESWQDILDIILVIDRVRSKVIKEHTPKSTK
jgi:hypothetical protein